ncbi:MAG: glycosyltransferase family 4 protein, partial [Aminipila sp.]
MMSTEGNGKKIISFHLLNDFSGSPKVLESVLGGLTKKGVEIDLYTSQGGVLDKLSVESSIKIIFNNYKFSENVIVQSVRFVIYQLYFFVISFRYIAKKDVVFYINTLLPVGAALSAFLMRKRIVYHYHENADAKGLLYKILSRIMRVVASDIICVSAYQAQHLLSDKKRVIPNSISQEYTPEFTQIQNSRERNILMVASLKKYKGILEFINLSRVCLNWNFVLVLSATQQEINEFLAQESLVLTHNIRLFSRQKDVMPFYKDASVLLNLSNPNLVIETFGLTVIEAMA